METGAVQLCALGVNHSTTPIAFREKLAISPGQLRDALGSLRTYASQGVILSTCNRTEVYTTAGDGRAAEQACIDFLRAHTNISDADLLPHTCAYKDEVAITHLFRVASGLDSMVIGEFEILRQVGQALETAEEVQMVDLPLRSLFRNAMRTGRRVRHETSIGRNALSVSSVAVNMAARAVGDISNCKVLIIGAGEAGTLVAKAARKRGAHPITVTSRSQRRASTLAAALGGRAVPLSDLEDELSTSDIVISCTGAPHPVLGATLVKQAMESRPEQPLVVIDIAVPRDVELAVEQIRNVFLYNIDHLTAVSESNRELREEEISRAVEIVDMEADRFYCWWRALEVRPTISALVRKAEEIRQRQLHTAARKLKRLSDEERASVEAMTRAIVKKLLHEPIQCLKENAPSDDGYTQVVRELFRLDEEKPE